MVSPQTLLALGIGLPLLMIAAYALWLGRRLARLEEQAPAPGEGEEAAEPPDGNAGARDSGKF